MKKVITAADVEKALAAGQSPSTLPTDAIWTPAAKDALKEAGLAPSLTGGTASSAAAALPPGVPTVPPEPILPDLGFSWEPGSDPTTPEEIQRFFYSPRVQEAKRLMVHVGHKIWKRGYVDGNGGNLTIRVGDNLILCTPTLVSKGELTIDHICLVDIDGNQKAGIYKRTSEVNTHLAIMKRNPKALSCCHAHPPHATAWAVAGQQPPTCMIPEAEVFLGQIGLAEYQTPGTPANAEAVGEVAKDHQSVLMINHGVITWGKDLEDAYWKMENTDAYCQTIWMAMQVGTPKTITQSQEKELIDLRGKLGMEDKRSAWKECELCDNGDFRPGAVCRIEDGGGSVGGGGGSTYNPEAEKLVQEITERIVRGG